MPRTIATQLTYTSKDYAVVHTVLTGPPLSVRCPFLCQLQEAATASDTVGPASQQHQHQKAGMITTMMARDETLGVVGSNGTLLDRKPRKVSCLFAVLD